MSKRDMNTQDKVVELLNVQFYNQGSFDSLCTYYAGAMMLATLFPEYAEKFGKSRININMVRAITDDPFIIHHPGNSDLLGEASDKIILAEWFYCGKSVKTMVEILKKTIEADKFDIMGANIVFDNPRKNETFKVISDSIENGLPVILGWDTEDMGDHTVLVTGYRYGYEQWLKIHDPSAYGPMEMNWNLLMAQQKKEKKFDIGLCDHDSYSGPRPMKSITKDSRNGEPAVLHVLQWTPQREWIDLYEPFDEKS